MPHCESFKATQYFDSDSSLTIKNSPFILSLNENCTNARIYNNREVCSVNLLLSPFFLGNSVLLNVKIGRHA